MNQFLIEMVIIFFSLISNQTMRQKVWLPALPADFLWQAFSVFFYGDQQGRTPLITL